MADEPQDVQEVVRTRRVEVIGSDGRAQLVLGDLSHPDQPNEIHGVAVLGEDGSRRAWLAVNREGVSLTFDRGGNAVFEVNIEDGTGDSTVSGVIVQASDVDGRPVIGLHVHDDGEFVVRGGTPQ